MNPALKSLPPILIVDDEEEMLATLREQLEWEGYSVVMVTSAAAALERLIKQTFSVIISDQQMPGMSGLDFFARAKNLRPNAVRVLITGILSLDTVVGAVNEGEIFRFLAKPWLRPELLATVNNAVQRYLLLENNQTLQLDTARLNQKLEAANAELQSKISELVASKSELDKALDAQKANFEQSLELCHRIIGTFYPLLGRNAKAAVELCRKLAETKYFPGREKHVLIASAWLHDIGLIGCDRELLHKFYTNPGSLSPEDCAVIRSHPLYGQSLASFVDQLTDVGATIRAHHERFDGGGYPDGLAGETIPWTARCLAVVTFFVECGLPKAGAAEAVLAESGKAFDPEAVRLFFKATQYAELPRKVREIMIDELTPGMLLAKGIFSPNGLLLVPEGQELSPAAIARIKNYNLLASVTHRLLVYS